MEIYSPDAGGYSHRHSDYPRRGKLHVTNWKLIIENWKLVEREDAKAQSLFSEHEKHKRNEKFRLFCEFRVRKKKNSVASRLCVYLTWVTY